MPVSAGNHHIAACPSAATSRLVGPAEEIIQGLSTLPCSAADADGESESPLGRLKDHALDRLTETFADCVRVLLDCKR